ncbi:MAG TPA: hypothetical protein DCX67_11925 [Opitutae bacterium]|nr:hypothetical protein [Opitutae bacterium]
MKAFGLLPLHFFPPLSAALCVCVFALSEKNEQTPGNQLESKMRTIILTKVDLHDVPFPEVINFLREAALKHDPDKVGVNFVLLAREKNPPKITLTLRNLSLEACLVFVTEMSGYEYEVRDQAVVVSKRIPRAGKQLFNPRLHTEIYELSEGMKRRMTGNR